MHKFWENLKSKKCIAEIFLKELNENCSYIRQQISNMITNILSRTSVKSRIQIIVGSKKLNVNMTKPTAHLYTIEEMQTLPTSTLIKYG